MRFIPDENDGQRYCDIGKFEGRWKIRGTIYLTEQEHLKLNIFDEMLVKMLEKEV